MVEAGGHSFTETALRALVGEIWIQASALTLEYGQILISLSLRFHCKRGIVIVLVAARRQAGRPACHVLSTASDT